MARRRGDIEDLMENGLINKIAFALLLASIVFTTLLFGAVHQSVLATSYVLCGVMVIIWAIDAIVSGKLRIGSPLLLIPTAGAFVYGIIQTIPLGTLSVAGVDGIARSISLDPFRTSMAALHFGVLTLFLIAALSLFNTSGRLRTAAAFITIFGFLFAFYAILQSVLSPTAIYGFYERSGAPPFGSFVSRNNFAAWIELAAVFPLALVITGAAKPDKRLLYLTAAVVMGVALTLSGSRGGLVAFVAQIAFLFLITLRARSTNALMLRVALGAILLVAVIAGTLFVGGDSSLTRLSEDSAASGTNVDRVHIWSVATRVTANNLPFGVGLGGFGAAYTRYDENSGFQRVEQAHNDFLQTASDAGIPGIALGVIFLGLFVRSGMRALASPNSSRRAIGAAAFAALFGVLIHSLFDFVLHTTAIALFFLLVLAMLEASSSTFPDDIDDDESGRRRRTRTA